jgi:hypothetical protein
MFMLLVVFGFIAVNEGIKGILDEIGLSMHPLYLLVIGLVILVLTGTIYKKLDHSK